MVSARLHYVFDPLCGWCYGAAPLIAAARALPGIGLVLHGGGMMSGPNRQPVTPALRRYVMEHDKRIAALSGQTFGEAYFNGLLLDETAVFDSTPPIAAILAAESLAGEGAALLARLQAAHYREGRRIADPAVLADIVAEAGLSAGAFSDELAKQLAEGSVDAHIRNSRDVLARIGGQGFPTLALETDGNWTRLDIGRYIGQPDAFAADLRDKVEVGATDRPR
ncbi:DsbA family protein [Paludibacterium paludis]|uniref:DsbA family protein n=1 Tax=Paludibacterium paludis TaxID=1225769 RepID=A0A918P3K0_9NEIS|nr:DsbA family protein [Paludibacterium paludis]GGY16954.1 DsbA family protein [Paludibacterium paludis]